MGSRTFCLLTSPTSSVPECPVTVPTPTPFGPIRNPTEEGDRPGESLRRNQILQPLYYRGVTNELFLGQESHGPSPLRYRSQSPITRVGLNRSPENVTATDRRRQNIRDTEFSPSHRRKSFNRCSSLPPPHPHSHPDCSHRSDPSISSSSSLCPSWTPVPKLNPGCTTVTPLRTQTPLPLSPHTFPPSVCSFPLHPSLFSRVDPSDRKESNLRLYFTRPSYGSVRDFRVLPQRRFPHVPLPLSTTFAPPKELYQVGCLPLHSPP